MSAEKKISFKSEAQALAKRGIHVFPIKPRSKDPLGQLVPHGCLDATTNPTKIGDWWFAIPSANIGIATGEKSGFFVVDVDPKNGGDESFKDLVQNIGSFRGTLTARTGSGGFHYLYKMPEKGDIRNSAGKIAPGIDIRGTGGYIVAPPSIHPNGNVYEWINDKPIADAPLPLLDLISEKRKAKKDLVRLKDGDMLVHGVQHDTLFYMGSTMRFGGFDEDAIFEALWFTNQTRCEIPGPEENIRDLAKSICRQYPQGNESMHTFIANVMKGGIIEEIETEDTEPEDEADEIELLLQKGFTATELLGMELPDIKWVVPGVLPEGATLLVGKPKTGKSFFALNLAVSVSSGGYALGNIKVNKGRVLYLVLEGSKKGLKKRLEALMAGATENKDLHFYPEWPKVDNGGLDQLRLWLGFFKDTELVIIDTLKMIRGRDTNRNVYERDYDSVNPYAHLAEEFDTSILIIHHTNKMPEADDPFDMASGSTGLMGAVDQGMVLRRSNKHEGVDLYVRGRDIEDVEMAMTFDQQLLTWINQGDSAEFGMNNTKAEILSCLQSLDINESIGPKEVSERTGIKYDLVKQTLGRMLGDGTVTKRQRGMYMLNPVTSVTSVTSSSFADNKKVTAPHKDTELSPLLSLSESPNKAQNGHISPQSDKGDRSDNLFNPTDEAPF